MLLLEWNAARSPSVVRRVVNVKCEIVNHTAQRHNKSIIIVIMVGTSSVEGNDVIQQ